MAIANIKYRYQQVALTAVPFILLMLSQSLNSLIDMFIVGRISVSAVAAVGLCGFIFSLLTSAVTGIMISVQTLVARSLGAGRAQQAIDALHSACVVALLAGTLIMLAIPLVPGTIRLIVEDGELAENCIIYLQTLMCAAPAIGCVRAFRGYFGGLGENRFSLLIIIGIYLCNFIIGYTLVSAGLGIRGGRPRHRCRLVSGYAAVFAQRTLAGRGISLLHRPLFDRSVKTHRQSFMVCRRTAVVFFGRLRRDVYYRQQDGNSAAGDHHGVE